MLGHTLFSGRAVGTSHQSLNAITRFNLRFVSRIAAPRTGRPIEATIVVGLGRSGTTIIGAVLSTFKDVGYLNEPKLMWAMASAADDLTGHYRDPGNLRLLGDDMRAEDVAQLTRSAAWYLRIGLRRQLVLKYPELIHRVPYVARAFPAARLIAVLRDPVATAISVARWNSTTENERGAGDWWGVNDSKWRAIEDEANRRELPITEDCRLWNSDTQQRDFYRALVEWQLAANCLLDLSRHGSELPVFAVRFEDLDGSLESWRELYEFAGLTPRPWTEDYLASVFSHQQSPSDARFPIESEICLAARSLYSELPFGTII